MVYLTQPRPETRYSSEAHSICAHGMLMQGLQMPTLKSDAHILDTAQYSYGKAWSLYKGYRLPVLQWFREGVQYLILVKTESILSLDGSVIVIPSILHLIIVS